MEAPHVVSWRTGVSACRDGVRQFWARPPASSVVALRLNTAKCTFLNIQRWEWAVTVEPTAVDRPQPVRRLPRVQRREQILTAATEAFARNGFAATGLDDIAAEAGVTRVILYRHFDSKTDLYQAVLDRMCARLDAYVAVPAAGFTDATVDGLLEAAAESPAGFRLLFQHALREPEFKDCIGKFRADTTAAAFQQISALVPDEQLARWAAQLAPTVAIEATIAWLDAGQPDRAHAAARVRQVIMGVILAAVASDADCSFPSPANTDGQAR
jgi:AcrR family transcriptional regulator